MSGAYHISLYSWGSCIWMCIYCSTHSPHVRVWNNQSVHTPPRPLSWQASILWSCWCRTSFRNSDRCSIIINIMIVPLPRSVCVHTAVKWRTGIPLKHEVLTFFLSLSCTTTSLPLSFISYNFFITFHTYVGVVHYANISYYISIISYISSCQTYVISYRIMHISYRISCHNIRCIFNHTTS